MGFLIFIYLCLSLSESHAYPTYSVRSASYMGYQTTLRGDINSVGMAGANAALPTSISASEINPAGGAMMMGSLAAQIVRNSIRDERIIDGNQKIRSNLFGITVSNQGWGWSYGSYQPANEISGPYEISVREHHFSISKLFFNKKLSIGASAILVSTSQVTDTSSQSTSDLTTKLGILYRRNDRLTFGTSFRPGYETSPQQQPSSITNFFQPVQTPWILSQGVGWYPNRLFKTGATLVVFGKTSNTGLLKDQTPNGREITYQPRIGASYVFGDFRNLKMEFSMGSYWESAASGINLSRLHQTMGLQINPYFVNTGIGIDRSKGYRNIIVSIGVDLVRTLRALEIIPKDNVKPQQRFFPDPFDSDCKGLPEGMCDEKRKKSERPPSLSDVKKIIEKIPERVQGKINSDSDSTPASPNNNP